MQRQVITIGPNGEITGLQVKPGKGVDLRQFGNAEIKRASDIVWDEQEQLWKVCVAVGAFGGSTLTEDSWQAYVSWPPKGLTRVAHATKHLLFKEYPDAVDAEIAFFNAVQEVRGSAAFA